MNNSGNLFGIAYAGRSVTFHFQDATDYISKKIIDSKAFYELDVLEEISGLSLGEGIFVDVGANIGNHTLFFSLILNREVEAFEPAGDAFAQLVRNVQLNRAEALVSCHRLAVGARQSRGLMNVVPGNLGASSFSLDDSGTIQLVTLDSMLYEKSSKVALIKIDVEGFELEVLQGAIQILDRDAPTLIVEGQTNAAFGEISQFLSARDYVPVSIRGITPTYFFVHREKLGSVQERSLFYIRRDVDHNRRTLQSYLARIESSLRGVLSTAEFEKLSSALESRQKSLLGSLPDHKSLMSENLNALASDMKTAVASAGAEQSQRIQLLSEILEHKFRVLMRELELDREARSSLTDELLNKILEAGRMIAEEVLFEDRSRLAEESARRQEFLDSSQNSLRGIADRFDVRISELDLRLSEISETVSNEIAEVGKVDLSTTHALLREQGSSVCELTDSVELGLKSLQEGLASLTAASARDSGLTKELEGLRLESRQESIRKEKELERAHAETERLQSEVNRLIVAVQTERTRARYAARRLNVLYTTGVRATFGKIRKVLSPLTFGFLKPYETWPSFEKRMEARVVREVQDFKKLNANSLRSPLPVPESGTENPRDLLVGPAPQRGQVFNEASYRDRVRIGIASIEVRRTALSRVIECLYDQADELLVYLNDYAEVPNFLRREKITVIHKQGDVGDRGKFYDIDNFSGYFFTCDDDIDYPPYYVQHCIDAIEKYGRKAVVGWHGSLLKKPFNDYYSPESRRVFSFRSGRPDDLPVHILGTGCSSFHTDTIDVKYSDFLTPNMADVYFALLGQRQRVPFVVIKHDASEAIPLDIPDDKPIHRESMQKTGSRADTREIQNQCVKNWSDWRAEAPTPVYLRSSYTIAYVGRVDAVRWKKGGILKSGGLITQALRALGHRVIDVEISQEFGAISEQIKPADIVWIYPGDPERPDFAPVEKLINLAAKADKQVYVNLSYNRVASRTRWIREKLKGWNSAYGSRVKACLFTYAALNEPDFHDVRTNLICIPKSIDFSEGVQANFASTEGIFLGDLQKLLNRSLVDGEIEDWILALRKALPGVPLYAVRQYGGKIDRDLGLTVLPYTHGRPWEEWLAARRIVCCLTPHATYEMIPVEAGGLGVPTVYRPMPQSHSEDLSTAGIQVHTPAEFAAACAAIYHDYTLWNMYSRAARSRAKSAHISQVAGSLHVQLALGRV
ncbi:FkbM family methyltransferase [Achromobacter sp. MFA1 R4]|uniref:FkbM family methyltransferase n=1 Tax=Achromobacter sp. MFA1 R4 TaxID=1881016 RepID=UPI0009538B29|nr:FkbM family methyltransferase [Achromobacter sp. MFA1 R4]SIT31364.1 methyltransferase, FkbM family [Achromobacter sp. MFA1 R4]